MALARGNWPAALASYRQAIGLLTGQDTSQTMVKSIVDDEIRRYRDTFVGLCRAAWQTREQPATDRAALLEETFQAGQQAWNTSAASALAKMTARIGAGDTDLGRRIRRVQDLSERILRLNADDQKLLTDWSAVQTRRSGLQRGCSRSSAPPAPPAPRDPAVKRQRELAQQFQAPVAALPARPEEGRLRATERSAMPSPRSWASCRKDIGAGAGAIMAIHQRMEAAEKALPGYADVHGAPHRAAQRHRPRRYGGAGGARPDRHAPSRPTWRSPIPKPLRIAEAQALLRPDEALVAILVGSGKSFVWAVTRERAEWAEIDAGAQVLAEHVAALRNGPRPAGAAGCGGRSRQPRRRRAGASILRARMRSIGWCSAPVAQVFAGKRHLIVVPTGALTSLPLQVLVTAPPPPPATPPAAALRDAAWLIKAHALSVLPSVQSLARAAHGSPAAMRRRGRSSAWAIPCSRGPTRPTGSAAPSGARLPRRRASIATASPTSAPCAS